MSKAPKIPIISDMMSSLDKELGSAFGQAKPLYEIAKYMLILSNPTTIALFAGYKIAPYFFTPKALNLYKNIGVKVAKLTGKGLFNVAKYTGKGLFSGTKMAANQTVALNQYFKEKDISINRIKDKLLSLRVNTMDSAKIDKNKSFTLGPEPQTEFNVPVDEKNASIFDILDNYEDVYEKQGNVIPFPLSEATKSINTVTQKSKQEYNSEANNVININDNTYDNIANNEPFVFDEIIISGDTKAVFTMDANNNIYQQFIISNNKCSKCKISEEDYNNFKEDALSKQKDSKEFEFEFENDDIGFGR